uniref:S8 family peptidase n=1 Tax=Acetatifactor sp. TaxID=1872090 RepID=UPI004056C536
MSQKIEDLLNLALETSEEVRQQTDTLNVGFDEATRSWELIVKYHGSLEMLETMNVRIEYLIAGYAILTVPENLVERVAELEEIEYVEKPKRYYYSVSGPTDGFCFPPVTMSEPFLRGSGTLIAVLDSGVTYQRREFRKENGETRIKFLWDQTLSADEQLGRVPPENFAIGVEFGEEQINQALQASSEQERFLLVPSIDVSGHGTAVAGIAAGYDEENGYIGVAPETNLLIVKLGLPGELGFPRTTEIMRGVTYALQKAAKLQMPLAINLSFGNSYGAHDGSSLLERFLDNAAEIGRTVICVGSGNEGSSGGHFAGNVNQTRAVELAVAEYETTLNLQIWKNYNDVYEIRLRSPGGEEAEVTAPVGSGKYTLNLEQTQVLVYLGEPTPYSVAQEIYLDMIPLRQENGPYINSGVWTIFIEPVNVVTGQYYLYLPAGAGRNRRTVFYRPTPEVSITIPSTASKVITVGAYDFTYDSYAEFSGRGYADADRTIGVVTAGLVKPDLVAPGVNVLAPDVYGGYTPVTGTSFATPIVTGSAALLMEWGIVRGNDPYLYGEKVKAYLRAGAQPLRGEMEYPNDRVGFGKLCVAESIPL